MCELLSSGNSKEKDIPPSSEPTVNKGYTNISVIRVVMEVCVKYSYLGP